MHLKAHFYLISIPILLLLGTNLIAPVFADEKILTEDAENSAIEQTLEHNFSQIGRAHV